MRMKGILHTYLEQFDTDTQDTFEKLVKHTAEVENVTEALKATDPIESVRRLNSIRNRVEEFVLNKFVCQ